MSAKSALITAPYTASGLTAKKFGRKFYIVVQASGPGDREKDFQFYVSDREDQHTYLGGTRYDFGDKKGVFRMGMELKGMVVDVMDERYQRQKKLGRRREVREKRREWRAVPF